MIIMKNKLNKMLNNGGFTLVELLVVLVILAILSTAIIPSMLGYIDYSKELLCKVNRSTILRGWEYTKVMEPEVTLEQYFKSNDGYKRGAVCPSDGTYTIEADNTITCSIHGKSEGDSGGGGGTPEEDKNLIPGTDIEYISSYWPEGNMFDKDGNYQLTAGVVFEYGGKYYVMTKDWLIYKTNAAGGPGAIIQWDILEEFSGKTWDETEPLNGGKLQHVRAGDLYKDSSGTYIFTPNQGGWGNMPPKDYPSQWYKIS